MSIDLQNAFAVEATPATISSFNRSAVNLPLACPACRTPIGYVKGLCGNRLTQAVMLQAERLGAELECGHCGLRFIHTRPSTSAANRSMNINRDTIRTI
ncbi:hypothetical protein [Planctomicrobium sp. SH527]|uniref:hypothetical protein n=1 Tax=Planctomicrobium sp. SH527 TaxID=3448123 RepID=UPI003F5B96DA